MVSVSRDVEFDEDASWDWSSKEEKESYDFLPYFDDDEEEGLEEPTSPVSPASPHTPASPDTPSPSSQEKTPKYRSLNDIYNETHDIGGYSLFCLFADVEPSSFAEANEDERWRRAMDEEIRAIVKNDTWELMSRPKDQNTIGVKWVFKVKRNSDGDVERYKARLVAKGYKQQEGVDYDEVLAPVARLETIRLLISLAAQNHWEVHQLDVKSAFLNGYLYKNVYIDQPPGYEIKGHEDKVLKLKKALYGLKQAPKAWNDRLDKYLQENGFSRCVHEYALYMKKEGGNLLYVCVYVDDLIFTGNHPNMFKEFKLAMAHEFETSDMGLMSYNLGIQVKQMKEGIFISQERYVREVLKKFNMFNCKPVNTPMQFGTQLRKEEDKIDPTIFRSLIGSLRYLTCTRPDILFAVGVVSRYMENPASSHMLAAKRILRYIKGTLDYGIFYSSSSNYMLKGYCDSDYAGDLDDRKSTSGFLFFMGDHAIAWSSKKQAIVTLSSCESEYVAATSCACHAIWLRRLLKELHLEQAGATKVMIDNKSTQSLAKNPVFHERTKHIDTRYHFIRDCVAKKEIELEYVKSMDQVADIFTKPLKFDDFHRLRFMLGVRKNQV
ncbi:hypothetical protein OROMI_006084 [Orobanche minor]